MPAPPHPPTEQPTPPIILTEPGPLNGQFHPVHGGHPDRDSCRGCIDCCHLPEISVTDEEAATLRAAHRRLDQPIGDLIIHPDPANPGWQLMAGPCIFRQYDAPLQAGGCRIYDDRPASCAIFTCALRTNLRRSL
jgi:Fe-S-cluster containining protein